MLSDIEGISDFVDDDLPLEDAGATSAASAAPAGDAVLAADAATGEPKAEVGAPDAETAELDELEAHEAALGAAEAEAEALPDPSTLLVRQEEEEPPAEPTASEVSGETPAAAPTADHGVAGEDEIQEEAHLAPPPKMDREAAAVHAEDAAVAADAPAERPEVFELTERTDAGSGDGAHADEVEEGVAEVDTAQTEDAGGSRGDAEAPGADEEHGDAPLVEMVGEPTPKEGVQEDGGADGAPAAPTRRASDGGGLVRANGGAADAVAEARALADAAKAAALDSAVAEAQAELDELRAAVPPRDPRPAVAERRRRRDALRGQTMKLRAQLEQLAADRLASERKLERLSDREAKMAGSTYRLPPAPVEASEEQVRGIKEEIKRLTALNAEMELQAPAQDETRFHIEKLQNERRHAQRRLRSLRAEIKGIADEAARATAELHDLHTRCVPSEMARKIEAKMGALKSTIASENAARVVAEREIGRKLRRVLRVRAALSGFLAEHGVGYADVNAAEHAAPLAAYVLDASSRVEERAEQTSFLSAKVEALRESYTVAAAELTRLVAARGRAQRHQSPLRGAPLSLSAEALDSPSASIDGETPAKTSASVHRLRHARVGASRGVFSRTRGSLTTQLAEALASETQAAGLMDAFAAADPDGTGVTNRADFMRTLISLGFQASKREIDATYEALAAGKAGRLPYRDLTRLLGEASSLPAKPKLPVSAIRPEKLKARVRPVVSAPVPLQRKAAPSGGRAAPGMSSAEPTPRAGAVSRKAAPSGARKPKMAENAGAAVLGAEAAQPTGQSGAAGRAAMAVVEGANELEPDAAAEGRQAEMPEAEMEAAGAEETGTEEAGEEAAMEVGFGTEEAGMGGAEEEEANADEAKGIEFETEVVVAGAVEADMMEEEAAVGSGGETAPSAAVASVMEDAALGEKPDPGSRAAAATSMPEDVVSPSQGGQAEDHSPDAPPPPARSSEAAVKSDFEDDFEEEDLDLPA